MTAPQGSALCLFTRGLRGFGLPIESVEAVIEPETLTPMPISPPRLAGLCPHRRQVLPVFRLDGSSAMAGEWVVILVRSEQGPWGVQADRDGIAVVPRPATGPADASTQAIGGVATVRHDGRSFDLIDPEACWSALRSEVQDHHTRRGPGPRTLAP